MLKTRKCSNQETKSHFILKILFLCELYDIIIQNITNEVFL